jgi:hypothetical protein
LTKSVEGFALVGFRHTGKFNKLGLFCSSLSGNRKLNTERLTCNSSGGYAGAQFTLAMCKRYQHYWVGGFVCNDNLHGVVFGDSFSVKQRNALWAGIAISWIFAESSTRAAVED